MSIRCRNVCAIVAVATLLLPCACVADTGGTRLQAQDSGGDHPPSTRGTVAELREQLNSDDTVIRSAAAGRLIEMRTVEAGQAIEEVLLRGREGAVLDLLKVIGSTRDHRLLPMVVARLRGTTDGIVDATFACLECFDAERVADALIPALDHADQGVAETARLVEALGRTRHRKAVEPLIGRVGIQDPVVLKHVTAALFLVTGHRFPSEAAWKAWWVTAQTRTREQWQEDALRATQADPESDIGAELARTKIELLTLKLAQVPADQPEARLSLVREAMEYKHAPQVRAFGATEAAKLPAAERTKVLAPLLALATQDPDDEARAAALEAIGEIAGGTEAAQKDAAAALGSMASGGPSVRVRVAAIHGLAKLPPSLAVERIRPALEDADRMVRLAAVEALGRMDSPDGVRELIARLPKTNDDPELRKAVVDAMGESGASEAVEPLVGLLREAKGAEARPLRWSIANSLSKIRTRSEAGTEALHELAEDPFLDVRVKAIQGLGAPGGADEVPFLTGILKGAMRDAKERSAAALALGQIADAGAIPDLLGALSGDASVAGDAWKGVLLIVGTDRPRAIDASRRLMEAQDWARAVELLDPAVQDPAFAKDSPDLAEEARDRLGASLLGAGRRADALPFLKESAERKEAPPEAKLRYVRALADLQHHAEAIALVAQWLAQEPAGSGPSWELKLERVRILHGANELAKGAVEAERLAGEPGVPEAVRLEAVRLRDLCRKGLETVVREESVPLRRVEALLDEVASGDSARRASALGDFGRLGRKAVPALLILAGGTDPSRWEPASEALGALTRIPHPLDARSTEEVRKKAVDAWREWYDRK